MYLLPKKIEPLTDKREKLFTKLLASDYKGIAVLEYKDFMIRKINQDFFKNVDFGRELRSLLAALSIVGIKNNLEIIARVEGEGSFSCRLFKTEMNLCDTAVEFARLSENKKVYLIAKIENDSLTVSINGKTVLKEKLFPANSKKFTSAKDFILDRLSPVNLAFAGELRNIYNYL